MNQQSFLISALALPVDLKPSGNFSTQSLKISFSTSALGTVLLILKWMISKLSLSSLVKCSVF